MFLFLLHKINGCLLHFSYPVSICWPNSLFMTQTMIRVEVISCNLINWCRTQEKKKRKTSKKWDFSLQHQGILIPPSPPSPHFYCSVAELMIKEQWDLLCYTGTDHCITPQIIRNGIFYDRVDFKTPLQSNIYRYTHISILPIKLVLDWINPALSIKLLEMPSSNLWRICGLCSKARFISGNHLI